MCQSSNCCVTCCVPTRGRSLWVTLAIALALSSALVCVWAWVAVHLDALVLLHPARLRLTDAPTVVASWRSPTARHLLAREIATGRVALPCGPGMIQATMALLAVVPAGLVVWVRCGAPVPAPVRHWLQGRDRARVVVARVPAPLRAVMRRQDAPTLPALPATAAEGTRVRAALPPSTSTATGRPRVAALPAPTRAPSSTASTVPPRFIRLAQPPLRDPDPATSAGAKRR